jgi:hypothetical protein
VGEKAEIQVPNGTMTFEVLKISRDWSGNFKRKKLLVNR